MSPVAMSDATLSAALKDVLALPREVEYTRSELLVIAALHPDPGLVAQELAERICSRASGRQPCPDCRAAVAWFLGSGLLVCR